MKTIDVIVSPDGKVVIETSGYTGSACQDASQAIEDALGVRSAEKLKPEAYQQSFSTGEAKHGYQMGP